MCHVEDIYWKDGGRLSSEMKTCHRVAMGQSCMGKTFSRILSEQDCHEHRISRITGNIEEELVDDKREHTMPLNRESIAGRLLRKERERRGSERG